jgi:hypothetical protein
MGRMVAGGGKTEIATRREKFARAVTTLVKKAGLAQAATAAAPGIGAALKKLLPYLATAGAGVGGWLAGRQKPGTGLLGGSGQQPLWGQHDKRMFGRMGIDPKQMQARTTAMRDVGAGGAWRAGQHKERMNLIRGMFTN